MQWSIIHPKRRSNYTICSKMNGTGDHSVKRNKPHSKRQASHIFFHMKFRRKRDIKGKGKVLGMWEGKRRGWQEW
jgi:hypothetical protein